MMVFKSFCLLVITSVPFGSCEPTYGPDLITMRNIASAFQRSNNLPDGWSPTGDPCNPLWDGVGCSADTNSDGTQNITEIHLSGEKLNGIPINSF